MQAICDVSNFWYIMYRLNSLAFPLVIVPSRIIEMRLDVSYSVVTDFDLNIFVLEYT